MWLVDEAGKPAKPYLTAIEDDYSRMIVGYQLSFQPATALTTALTLRQAIWCKEDPQWSACGIPSVFYTDHGSDFTSKHLEQVAADLGWNSRSGQAANYAGSSANAYTQTSQNRQAGYTNDTTDTTDTTDTNDTTSTSYP